MGANSRFGAYSNKYGKQKSWVDIITKITYYGQGVMGRMNELECYSYKDMGT